MSSTGGRGKHFSHNFQASGIYSGTDADHSVQGAEVSGQWTQAAHSLSFHHSGDYAVLEACPTYSLEAQITGKAYGMGEEFK